MNYSPFYGVYVVVSFANDSGQMEKLGVLITQLEPQFSGFLPPQSLTFDKPFQEVSLKGHFNLLIFIGGLTVLDFLNFLE